MLPDGCALWWWTPPTTHTRYQVLVHAQGLIAAVALACPHVTTIWLKQQTEVVGVWERAK